MKISFSAEMEIPDGTPIDEVDEWLEFELGARASLKGTNALASMDLHSAKVSNVYASEN